MLEYAGILLSVILGLILVILLFIVDANSKKKRVIIVAIYTIVPPLWFWIEYNWFFHSNPPDFEAFKYRQELNRNIWALL
jgi:hypothetical protein